MNIKEAIDQLKELRADRESFLTEDEPDSEFAKDIEAIDTVIAAFHETRSLGSDVGGTVVYNEDYVHALAIFEGSIVGGSIRLVPDYKFDWHTYCNPKAPEDVFEYLTLDEISEQYEGASPMLLAVYESATGGVVYQYNNYNDKKWHEVGTLNGYA